MIPAETHELHWKRIQNTLRIIGSRLLPETQPLKAHVIKCSERTGFSEREKGERRPLAEGGAWGAGNDKAWFKIEGIVPAGWRGKQIVLWLDVGSEALVYRRDGSVLHGVTPGSFFNNIPWEMSRPFLDISEEVQAGDPIEFWAEAGCLTHPWEENYEHPIPPSFTEKGFTQGVLHYCRLGLFNPLVWALYMDLEVLIGLCNGLTKTSPRYAKIFRALRNACDQFGRDENDLKMVQDCLSDVLSAPASHSDVCVRATGHAHLDTAWLWPLAVTRQKASRTFSNQLSLLQQYPDYIFGASTALHYQWIKEDFPELYERICDYVKQGRWEIQGAMWVEADVNVPSGEALIRQFLYGKDFFKNEFDQEIDLLWLPDVFGYSAALPQIMKICGVPSLLTQKISWSQFNQFPHHTFLWEGIDGTDALVHFPPENNYCSSLEPKGLLDAQARFAERDRLDSMLSLFGYGDGGGGPTPFHLERARRMKNLEGAPKVEMGRADKLFETFHEQKDLLARWRGELYLELHRKTLTTQAFIKKANRRLEEQLVATEMLFAGRGREYPRVQLDEAWKTLLLNQFHDILPGSSIKEVYDEARGQFDCAFDICRSLQQKWADDFLGRQPGHLVAFNSLSTEYNDLIELPDSTTAKQLKDESGRLYPVQRSGNRSYINAIIPALTFKEFQEADTESSVVESCESLMLANDLVSFEFSRNGRLINMKDLKTGFCYMDPGAEGNELRLYNDRPAQWEAWDMDIYYENELIEVAECISVSPLEMGASFQALRFEFKTGRSVITQTVRLRNGSRRLDFETDVDWHETRRLLRVAFTTSILSAEASYEIQCGYLKRPTHRNTSREAAMFEVCGHRYADLSQSDSGVALLNDCKYGYKVHGGELSLSLLASPCVPDPQADRGAHRFTYSILPHPGSLVESEVRRAAASLNVKPVLWPDRCLKDGLALPVELDGENIRMEALKQAENGSGVIVRISETAGQHSSGTLQFVESAQVLQSDAIEWTTGDFTAAGKSMGVSLRPFEIQTWRICFG